MPFRVEFSDLALKRLKKMDRPTAALIVGYVDKNLVGCSDPHVHGKALSSTQRGKWRYRVGDYRLLALIEDERILITIIEIGHRSDIHRC